MKLLGVRQLATLLGILGGSAVVWSAPASAASDITVRVSPVRTEIGQTVTASGTAPTRCTYIGLYVVDARNTMPAGTHVASARNQGGRYRTTFVVPRIVTEKFNPPRVATRELVAGECQRRPQLDPGSQITGVGSTVFGFDVAASAPAPATINSGSGGSAAPSAHPALGLLVLASGGLALAGSSAAVLRHRR